MNFARWMLILVVVSLLGCSRPVPPEKSAYVGAWEGKAMYLLITQDGSVQYKRVNGGTSTSLNAPLNGFIGNNFEVGVGPFTTVFVVSKPPYKDGGSWKMVVDDVVLTRTAP